jgi:hypothetical protein
MTKKEQTPSNETKISQAEAGKGPPPDKRTETSKKSNDEINDDELRNVAGGGGNEVKSWGLTVGTY